LRKSAVAIALVLVASLGIVVPSVAAATGPKVVIVVGATQGTTAAYRADGDVAYAEARKYTPNVVKVYSPNATWAKVKAAVAGASVVIYMGHGNGWPSPYAADPNFTTKDGFGLNAAAGAGDSNNKYYGEPSIATLDLAPGAIVLLHHLCYASGNSEPGNAEPTTSVAHQRADNYAAGFLKAGASAVIADGHAGAESYLRALFTTHQSLETMWRTMPDQNGNVISFASKRTPGATLFQDPSTPTSGFYRSLAVATRAVTTDDVVSPGYVDTGADPTSLVVPGNAAVATDGAGVYGAANTVAAPGTTLPAGTRLHIVAEPVQASATGAPLVEVRGLDDPSITGFMIATDLLPRDSTAPVVRTLDVGGALSPNADGIADQATLSGSFTETVAWTVRVLDAGHAVLFEKNGTGVTFEVSWNGLSSGHPVADGTYTVSVSGTDAWSNGPAGATRPLTVDTKAPAVTALTPGPEAPQWFSPNGDAFRETVVVTGTSSEAGVLVARLLDAKGGLVKTWSVPVAGSATAVTWDGRNSAGATTADGVYTLRIAARDAAGNTGKGLDRTVNVVGALRFVSSSKKLFFPHDKDSLSTTTGLSFVLGRPMTVTWTVRNAAGATVATHFAGSLKAAGTYAWAFNGRGTNGTMLPRGRYTSDVTATDGTVSAIQTTAFEMDAFVVKPSDTTPGRGQSIKITVTSAEKLSRTPTVYISQRGLKVWSVRMTETGTYTYKVTFRLKKTGKAGKVSFKVWGRDVKGGTQATTRTYVLH
jgi:flagellar hook assembly protein FlgD